MSKIIVTPAEMLKDHRLNKAEYRVLHCLYSFKDKNMDTVWPHRETIAERIGYSVETVSRAITGLVNLGWLDRTQQRGPNVYTIHVPDCLKPVEITPQPALQTLPPQPIEVIHKDINSDHSAHPTVTTVLTPNQTKEHSVLSVDNTHGLEGAEAPPNLGAEGSPSAPCVRCPHKEIIEIYHRELPMCPPVTAWPESRAKGLRSMWRADEDKQDLEWWEGYFEYVRRSKFLTGKSSTGFIADLEWITQSCNFNRIYEGKYHHHG